jgi:uncharacterized protein (TIGR03435 family)
MSIKLIKGRYGILVAFVGILLLAKGAFCQSTRGLTLEQADIQPSNPGDQVVTVGILPDGHIRFRNATLRTIIAAAYDVDENRVSGGPAWIDTEHVDITAETTAETSREARLLMLQRLLVERFKLGVHHDKTSDMVYSLAVGAGGLKLQTLAVSGSPDCSMKFDQEQIHRLCHSYTMANLAEMLPEVAPNYLSLPVMDETGLKGTYDFQLDWMGRGQYDAAIAAHAAGAPADPLAVSIFDAVAKFGLVLNKRPDPKDIVVIEHAEHASMKDAPPSVTAAHDLTPDQEKKIDSYVAEEMKREHIPGLEVGIYNRGQILLAKGYGLANVELNVPVKPETVFQSGSVGKQFVSAAVMLLVEEGKVGLDDSIVKYFPNAPASWKTILVKNLLSHTSGLAEYETLELRGPRGPFYLRLDFTEDELVEKVEALPIEFKPGEQWNYRNTNYLLLGVMVHKVTGRFYADYLQEKIFKPWYMTATRLISEKDIIPNRSSGYEWAVGKLHNQDWVSPTFNSTGDGTLYFNVLDLAKWDEALYGTSLLKQSSLDRIWTVFPLNDGKPNPAHYGFGWGIDAVNGHRVIEHGGAWQGFTCDIRRYVDDHLTVVVLANLAGAQTDSIAQMIGGLVNPALMPAPPKEHKEIAVNPKAFDGYLGKFELAPGFIITITRAGDRLFAQATGQPVFPLFAEGERNFFLKVVDAQITFVTDTEGRATELILHQNGDHHAKRIE